MTTGKRPTRTSSPPWRRWVLVLGALVVAGGVVWWMTRPSAPGGDVGAAEEAAAGPGPQPLDLSAGGPTVQAAAAVDANSIMMPAAGEYLVELESTDTHFRCIRTGGADVAIQLEALSAR